MTSQKKNVKRDIQKHVETIQNFKNVRSRIIAHIYLHRDTEDNQAKLNEHLQGILKHEKDIIAHTEEFHTLNPFFCHGQDPKDWP